MEDVETAPTRPRRGRRPAGIVRAEVLEATATLMFDDGLRAVSFDRVASRAAVSKTTIYKWWPSPGSLAAEAFFTRSETELAFADTGDMLHDVRTQLRAFVHLVTTAGSGRAIAELIGAAQSDPNLSASVSKYYTVPRRTLAIDYFTQARKRGQLRSEVDLSILVDQLWGACYNRLLVPDEPLNMEFADALVSNALQGAASDAYRKKMS